MKVWMIGYFPMTMGGKVHRPIICDVPVEGPFDLGAGYTGYVVRSPGGSVRIAESITGAVVGPDLETVRQDVAEAVVGVMAEQVEQAKGTVKSAQAVTPEQFWQMMDRGIL
jgi:hypothetical protein